LEIDYTDIDATLLDHPVAIKLSTSSGISGDDVSAVFDELGSSSLKIAVTEDDGTTQQYVEVASWDSTSEVAWLHTKCGSISSSANTVLYLYYDSAQSDNTTYVGVQGSSAGELVWDSSFLAVFHSEDTSSPLTDSTSNDRDATGYGTPTYSATGIMEDAVTYGSGDYHRPGTGEVLQGLDDITCELWVKSSSLSADRVIYAAWKAGGDGLDEAIMFYYDISPSGQWRWLTKDSSGASKSVTVGSPSTGSWFYLVGVYERNATGGSKLYENAGTPGTTDTNNYSIQDCTVELENIAHNTGSHPEWRGEIDEVDTGTERIKIIRNEKGEMIGTETIAGTEIVEEESVDGHSTH